MPLLQHSHRRRRAACYAAALGVFVFAASFGLATPSEAAPTGASSETKPDAVDQALERKVAQPCEQDGELPCNDVSTPTNQVTRKTDQSIPSAQVEQEVMLPCRGCYRSFAFLGGVSSGVGYPTVHSTLASDQQRMVTGLAPSLPSLWFAATVPVRKHWELMVAFQTQLLWGGHRAFELSPSIEFRARAFPGFSGRRWQEFFVIGAGYGYFHQLVHAKDIPSDENIVPISSLQVASSGPVRILGGMGARWSSSRRLIVEIEVAPYLLVPDLSFHVDFSLGVGVKL